MMPNFLDILADANEPITSNFIQFPSMSIEPRMLNQTAVGKGLNVKGKSAKRNHLSGFVPFLQISDNKHKRRLGRCPENSRVVVYFQSKEQQELAKLELEPLMQELQRDHALDPIRPRVVGTTYFCCQICAVFQCIECKEP